MASGTGNLPNPGMSFSPFAILTAEEQNDLVENIESLATGTGVGDGAITTSAIADAAITAPKVDSAAITPNKLGGLVGGLEIQAGTSSVIPSGANVVTAINTTFPTPFSGAPVVTICLLTTSDNLQWCAVSTTTTTGFTAYIRRTNTSLSYISWIAVYRP